MVEMIRQSCSIIRIFISIMLLLITHELAAQTDPKIDADTLIGLVVNQKGKAMSNIPVSFPGKKLQHTNRKGIFVFPNVSLTDTLSILLPKSRIWQIPVSGWSFLKITILDNNYSVVEAKDEIIDIGYGTVQKRTDVSGNVVISGDELRQGKQTDLMRALVGKVAGLQVVRTEEGEAKFVIRGGSISFVADNAALCVLDGVIVSDFDHVDIYSVESVTIMKDASIYGVQGANGAVVIKTKIE